MAKKKDKQSLLLLLLLFLFGWIYYKKKEKDERYMDFVNRPEDQAIIPTTAGISVPETASIDIILPENLASPEGKPSFPDYIPRGNPDFGYPIESVLVPTTKPMVTHNGMVSKYPVLKKKL